MEEEQKRVPARRRVGAGPVFMAVEGIEVAEGEVYELGVWPEELTEAHGWEAVTKTQVREARAEAAKEETASVPAETPSAEGGD